MENISLPNQQLGNQTPNFIGLDNFLTVSVIGKGSYAKVILVRKKDTDELYAMKVLKKQQVEQKKQENHVRTERNILVAMNGCPFLINFYYSFQTKKKLHFILEYCPGGELFNLLQKKKRFNEDQAKFYAAQMVLALEYLHKANIVYRDLKPENVLIDGQGYIKIADFGLSRMNVKTNEAKSICGTPEYLAPEIILKLGYGKPVDWWTLGCIIYEMLAGIPPFYTNNRQELFEKIKFAAPKYPPYLSNNSKSLLEGLLKKDCPKRLGSLRDAEEIKEHPWFSSINWDDILNKRIPSPFRPKITNDMGLGNFDTDFTEIPIQSYEQTLENVSFPNYPGFSYTITSDEKEKWMTNKEESHSKLTESEMIIEKD